MNRILRKGRPAAACLILTASLLLHGCGSGVRTETVVMPSEAEDIVSAETMFERFRIADIYRLPESFTRSGQLLGWMDADTVLASAKDGAEDKAKVKRLSLPYERSQTLHKAALQDTDGRLSPDGKWLAEMPTSPLGKNDALTLVSVSDGSAKKIPLQHFQSSMFIQSFGWSDNGKYLAYLVMDAANGGSASLGVYQPESGSSRSYRMRQAESDSLGKTLLSAKISDDGSRVLLSSFRSDNVADNEIAFGELNDSGIDIRYTHSMESEQVEWLDRDQFLFIGAEGTLYQYDLRNGDLSVLAEKAGSFALSPDRSRIAYYAYDEEAIYAGQIQGKNLLYKEPIYHGLMPEQLMWSPDRESLLVYGSKLYASAAFAPNDSENRQAFIIRFQ